MRPGSWHSLFDRLPLGFFPLSMPSRPGEFHPEPLTEPDSTH
jgi:hypothetical protein